MRIRGLTNWRFQRKTALSRELERHYSQMHGSAPKATMRLDFYDSSASDPEYHMIRLRAGLGHWASAWMNSSVYCMPNVLFVVASRNRLDWGELQQDGSLDFVRARLWPYSLHQILRDGLREADVGLSDSWSRRERSQAAVRLGEHLGSLSAAAYRDGDRAAQIAVFHQAVS